MSHPRPVAPAAPAPAVLASATLALAALLMASAVAHAAKPPKPVDRIWTHPDFASFGVGAIALLPAASFDNQLDAERQVDAALGVALRSTSYRWVSSVTTRAMLRSSGGDSLLRAVRNQIVERGRVDSLAAPRLCALLRVQALLAVRIETWEQVAMEWDQSGKPTTSAALRAALVDSLGRLAWTAQGREVAEGPYHEARPPALGMSSSGLGTQPVGNETRPPGFDTVLAPMFARWVAAYPPRSVPGAAAPRDSAR